MASIAFPNAIVLEGGAYSVNITYDSATKSITVVGVTGTGGDGLHLSITPTGGITKTFVLTVGMQIGATDLPVGTRFKTMTTGPLAGQQVFDGQISAWT